MKFYAVVSTFYDDGRTTANTFTVCADSKPESTFKSTKRYDQYVDFFSDPAEAEEYRQNTLRA